jgi:C-terminal processing protease CtpA/Prc
VSSNLTLSAINEKGLLQALFCWGAWGLWFAQSAYSQPPAVPTSGSPADRAADFDQLWREVGESYVYLGDKADSWRDLEQRYAARVKKAQTLDAWTSVLGTALRELADFHVEVSPRPNDDWRPVPTCAMIWAEWRNDEALITGVQPGGNAARAQVLPGDIILKIDGRAVDSEIPAGATQALRDHFLLQQLAGRRGSHVDLDLRTPDLADRSIRLEGDCRVDRPETPITVLRTAGGYGLIRFNNSLGETGTVTAFDNALATLRDAPGLIVDLRDTPSGGNSTVALGVLGRFIDHRAPYQMHRIPNFGRPDVERVWLEEVTPRGPFQYINPVVILADHWTGSMGEGMASGFDGLHRAIVVGTSLGRLNGSVQTVTLQHTHVVVDIPEEQIFHVSGVPRHEWNPPVLVDLVATRGQADPELATAERVLKDQLVRLSH